MAETDGFTLTHTMVRVVDPEASLAFYRDVLGMQLVQRYDFEEDRFTLYFLQAPGNGAPVTDTESAFARPGLLELVDNWDEKTPMHDGNTAPKGYGHICIAVPDLAAAMRHFDAHHVAFHKRPEEGGMRNVAFLLDPDGYRIEIVQPDLMPSVLDKS